MVHEFERKLNDGCPANENIAIALAEGMPSLRNFSPNPGEVLITSGVVLLTSEILMIPKSPPLKIPVYGWSPTDSHFTLVTVPLVWTILSLPSGMSSPTQSNVALVS